MRDLIDICESRHRGARMSREAFDSIRGSLPERRRIVLDFVSGCGERGTTCRELAAAFGVGMNCVSGRLSELKAAGLVEDIGIDRDGCSVVRVTQST